ncbi:hypothetical protein [Streptomyces sp.]|uniref:hypothetical protein n=1 Tax=Streptomyces sp. TaxID=1931 RepID=UPI002D2EE7AF|nr:hypothetical protein [Streptomyces sp.]HZF88445.1 hypothetical protein [Streptomyces sp.]
MADKPMGPLGTEMREVTFPDQSRGIILVQAGTPQDEADGMAARLWADLPKDQRRRVAPQPSAGWDAAACGGEVSSMPTPSPQ